MQQTQVQRDVEEVMRKMELELVTALCHPNKDVQDAAQAMLLRALQHASAIFLGEDS